KWNKWRKICDRQGKYFILLCISFLCAIYILNRLFPVGQIETYGDWLTYAFQVIGIYGSVSLLFFYSMDRGMRDFSLRIKGIIYR
ncbi:MAG: hypothetical protein RSB69_09870, partial [Odoribacter sp.]